MWVDTTYRSKELEIMDDLEMDDDILINTLNQIARINQWLGGNKVALSGVKSLLHNHPKNKELSIVDLGCGNGDTLREVAKYGRRNGYNIKLLGIDANQTTIDYAIRLSTDYPEIDYLKEDVLADDFAKLNYDIALCTLFLHHFEDEVAIDLIQTVVTQASIGVVVNDLHRHPVAYYLFKLLATVIRNHMFKTDGLISILKGFKRKELERFSKSIANKSSIHWKWAFRYQWIIEK